MISYVQQKQWNILFSIVSLSATPLHIEGDKQTQNLAGPDTECTELPRISHELVFSSFVLWDVMGPQRKEERSLIYKL